MVPLTLIIGKDSNLSNELSKTLSDPFFLISARDLLTNVNILSNFKNAKKNIIFNNFYPSAKLNDFEGYEAYLSQSILTTSIVLDYFRGTEINKIIYTSSSAVYGNNSQCSEGDDPVPLSFHSAIKISNEKLVER